jgi:hypothetical protein
MTLKSMLPDGVLFLGSQDFTYAIKRAFKPLMANRIYDVDVAMI